MPLQFRLLLLPRPLGRLLALLLLLQVALLGRLQGNGEGDLFACIQQHLLDLDVELGHLAKAGPSR